LLSGISKIHKEEEAKLTISNGKSKKKCELKARIAEPVFS